MIVASSAKTKNRALFRCGPRIKMPPLVNAVITFTECLGGLGLFDLFHRQLDVSRGFFAVAQSGSSPWRERRLRASLRVLYRVARRLAGGVHARASAR
jgi:hypothetical protein